MPSSFQATEVSYFNEGIPYLEGEGICNIILFFKLSSKILCQYVSVGINPPTLYWHHLVITGAGVERDAAGNYIDFKSNIYRKNRVSREKYVFLLNDISENKNERIGGKSGKSSC